MSIKNGQLTTSNNHKDFFTSEAVKKKFSEVLNGNSSQFITSLLSIVNNNRMLAGVDNNSIYTAAIKAAALKLPIDESLGFAYIVPYGKKAQFQLGYKGLIQLAIRSGQVKNINSGVIYKSQFISYDPLFENLDVDFSKKADEPCGYFATLELLNGFKKLIYWDIDKVRAHGRRFSKSYDKSPWATDFDAMAQKTLLKQIISKYAPLSADLQNAIIADNETEEIKHEIKDVTGSDETLEDLLDVPENVDPETGEILENGDEEKEKEGVKLFEQLGDLLDDGGNNK